MNKKDYLFYVRYCMSGLFVYHCKTDDPFHVMGEMTYRCPEHIDRINFVEQTESKLKFWDERGHKIREWENKYEKVSSMNKWISVKDRLPTDSDFKYLTIEDDGRRYVATGWYDPYEPEWDCPGEVIAWMDMDMPEVYEGE